VQRSPRWALARSSTHSDGKRRTRGLWTLLPRSRDVGSFVAPTTPVGSFGGPAVRCPERHRPCAVRNGTGRALSGTAPAVSREQALLSTVGSPSSKSVRRMLVPHMRRVDEPASQIGCWLALVRTGVVRCLRVGRSFGGLGRSRSGSGSGWLGSGVGCSGFGPLFGRWWVSSVGVVWLLVCRRRGGG
jgi:hypothetical protein